MHFFQSHFFNSFFVCFKLLFAAHQLDLQIIKNMMRGQDMKSVTTTKLLFLHRSQMNEKEKKTFSKQNLLIRHSPSLPYVQRKERKNCHSDAFRRASFAYYQFFTNGKRKKRVKFKWNYRANKHT